MPLCLLSNFYYITLVSRSCSFIVTQFVVAVTVLKNLSGHKISLKWISLYSVDLNWN